MFAINMMVILIFLTNLLEILKIGRWRKYIDKEKNIYHLWEIQTSLVSKEIYIENNKIFFGLLK